MNAILDVHYRTTATVTACVRFRRLSDNRPHSSSISVLNRAAEYRPGRFFERELPSLLHALKETGRRYEIILIDGFVHLQPPLEKGLGLHLAESLEYPAGVIGVAKNPLKTAARFLRVFRGKSLRPLFVSSVNIPVERAAEMVRNMHGEFRIPTLIKEADLLCRRPMASSPSVTP